MPSANVPPAHRTPLASASSVPSCRYRHALALAGRPRHAAGRRRSRGWAGCSAARGAQRGRRGAGRPRRAAAPIRPAAGGAGRRAPAGLPPRQAGPLGAAVGHLPPHATLDRRATAPRRRRALAPLLFARGHTHRGVAAALSLASPVRAGLIHADTSPRLSAEAGEFACNLYLSTSPG